MLAGKMLKVIISKTMKEMAVNDRMRIKELDCEDKCMKLLLFDLFNKASQQQNLTTYHEQPKWPSTGHMRSAVLLCVARAYLCILCNPVC